MSAIFLRWSSGVGTAMMNTSPSQGADCARRLALTCGSSINACNSSSLMCMTPSLIARTRFSLMSTPTTLYPAFASISAAGRPTYPVPMTTLVSFRSVTFVDLFLPFDSARDALFQRHRAPVIQIAPRFAVIRFFVAGIVRLDLDVLHQLIIFAQILENHVRQGFDVVVLVPGDVVHLARLEMLGDVCQRAGAVGDVGRSAMVLQVDGVRQVVERVIDETADHAAVGGVELARPVGVEQAQAHRLRAEAIRRIHDLLLVDPFGDRVVVHLADGVLVQHVLGHDTLPIAIDLGTAGEDHAEAVFLLHPQDVLGADGVALTQRFVIILAVPAATFCRSRWLASIHSRILRTNGPAPLRSSPSPGRPRTRSTTRP